MPAKEPEVAVMYNCPALGAVNSPAVVIVPPLAFQPNAGCVVIAFPNWSKPQAANCSLPPWPREAVFGVTRMPLSTGVATTVFVLLAERPLGSTTVTLKVYEPASEKTTIVFPAAVVPLA